MASVRFPTVFALALATSACGPTLTRGAKGWHESNLGYSIAPLDNGAPFPAGWTLQGYTTLKDGFRRDDAERVVDFELRRKEDDGVLFIKTYTLEKEEDRAK